MSLGLAFTKNFLGEAPRWYKMTVIAFLIVNPILLFVVGPFVTGWIIILEFIFTLAMALKCYPLPPAGLLAIESVIMGLTSPATVYHETHANFPVIMLLMFMVAGIYFMQEGLLFLFTKILVGVKSKVMLSLLFCFMGAFLSAFLDALTVTAVIISVAYGFYGIFHKYSSTHSTDEYNIGSDDNTEADYREDLDKFREFLRNLMMHGAVGTALGGATTLVGEPQNLIIGEKLHWHFADFFLHSAPVSIPVLIVGLITCVLLELTGIMGYGAKLPEKVRAVLEDKVKEDMAKMDTQGKARLVVQGIMGLVLIVSLALHIAEVGVIGLMIIVLLTAFNGVISEGQIGHAFEEALPFTALLVVFFAIVAVIHDQHLFQPVINHVLALQGQMQLVAYYVANGILSAISDNVFVATVYMNETATHFQDIIPMLGHPEAAHTPTELAHLIQFQKLGVAINMGTNIPSVATPNGQAAFLFLLTSALAPLIRLSYLEMVKLAFPYTVTMSITGFFAVLYLL
ncbi:Na+H+ antiporter NhaB [Denitrovibrio acetiphilus DSM 12809]|uniref:Na+H+ antiporter NhaB n=1 Tax=Denitrovibrio acetiphilus (strain DSM 12809 / NBRC 114555 / N2460) TaxID=522772 RepID=D4H0U5_DENA2|nr:sodium/proton antiporter NhaB [Denitrovibrio acetiphilus]ADD68608.1 Na+H+ antiporter NhaB [Denitrovibrio acetiphilus DSM 12809]